MDPLLEELVEEGDGAEQVEVILKLQQGDVVPPDVQVVARFGDIATCRLRRDHIRQTWEDPGVVSVKAPRYVAAEPDVSETNLSPDSQNRVSQSRRPEGVEQTGRGVVIGIVDWGCDFAHPNFRKDDGSTRLLALWDQSNSISKRVATPYGYGVAYSQKEINRALGNPNPYQSLGYHPADGDPGEIGAHGTHICDIAAGNGRVAGGPIGVAPQSDIVFVHLAARGISKLLNLGDSVRILEALDFIARVAADRPWVANLSVGRCGGPHTGLTLVEQGMDALLLEAPGRFIGESTGNYFGEQMHAAGRLRPGEERILTWRIDKADFTPNELEIWYSGHDSLTVEMQPPNGQTNFKASLGEQSSIQLNGREVGRIYHRLHDPSNGSNHINTFLYPAAPAGAWQVKLTGADIVDGRFHAWVERDNTFVQCQSRFDQKDAVSLTTTGTICNGFRTIAVGAYDSSSPDLRPASFSSSGPTVDGRSKPDLVAPGVHILAARSAPRDVQGKFPLLTFKSGTSMAAPYVTGCVALMFEAARRPLWIHETRRLLLSNTRRLPIPGEIADRVGNGYLDIKQAVEAAARFAGEKQFYTKKTPSNGRPYFSIIETEQKMTRESKFENGNTAEASMNGEVEFSKPEESEFSDYEDELFELDIERLIEDETFTPFNVYIYVVGSDKQGKSDFNEMRKLLQNETKYEYPWLSITYDYKKGEKDAQKAERRWTWKKAESEKQVSNSSLIGTDLKIIFENIESMAERNYRIKHLHFLTHFGDDRIYYTPHSPGRDGFTISDLKKSLKNPSAFSSAFASGAVIKIHGCQLDRDVLAAIKEFCSDNTSTKRRQEILDSTRKRIQKSYPFQLASLINQPVWATPIGAYAIYECTYLAASEKGRRFCVENDKDADHTFQRTLRFYNANYGQVFDLVAGESVFDETYHMKYKPQLRSLNVLAPSVCPSTLPLRGSVTESEELSADGFDNALLDEEADETGPYEIDVVEPSPGSKLVGLAEALIHGGGLEPEMSSRRLLSQILGEAGTAEGLSSQGRQNGKVSLSPAKIFDTLAFGKSPESLNRLGQGLRVVAQPATLLEEPLLPGDVLLCRAVGEGNVAHTAFLVSGEKIHDWELTWKGLIAAGNKPGIYAEVVEAGTFPHCLHDRFARRIADERGRAPYDQMILRIGGNGVISEELLFGEAPGDSKAAGRNILAGAAAGAVATPSRAMPSPSTIRFYESLPRQEGGHIIGAGYSGAVRSWFWSLRREIPKFEEKRADLEAQKRLLQETINEEGRDVEKGIKREIPDGIRQLVRRTGQIPNLLQAYRNEKVRAEAAAMELNAAVDRSHKAENALLEAEKRLEEETLLKKRAEWDTKAKSIEEKLAEKKELLSLLVGLAEKLAGRDLKGAATELAKEILFDYMDANARDELMRITLERARIDAKIAAVKDERYILSLKAAGEELSASFNDVAAAGMKLGLHAQGSKDALQQLVMFEGAHRTGKVFQEIRDYYVLAEKEGKALYRQTRDYVARLKGHTFGEADMMRRLVEVDMKVVQKATDDKAWWDSAMSVHDYVGRFSSWQSSEVAHHEELLSFLRSGKHLELADQAMRQIERVLGAWEP